MDTLVQAKDRSTHTASCHKGNANDDGGDNDVSRLGVSFALCARSDGLTLCPERARPNVLHN